MHHGPLGRRHTSPSRPLPLLLAAVVALSMTMSVALTPAPAFAGEHSAIKKAIAKAVGEHDYGAVGNYLVQLSGIGDAEAMSLILKTLGVVPPEEVLEKFTQALRAFPIEVSGPAVEKFLGKKKKNPIVVAAILTASVSIPGERAEGWAVSELESRSDLSFRNALSAVVERKSKLAIPVLFTILGDLKKHEKLMRRDIVGALFELTAQEFETVEDWNKWWDTSKDHFDPKKAHADGDGKTGVAKRDRDEDSAEFFGVEIISNKVMFIIDRSGSMMLWDEGGEEGSGSTTEYKESRQRINRVKKQLQAAIAKLPKGSYFNVVSFSDKINVFSQKGLVPANGKWKKKSRQFIAGLKAQGLTHTDDALKKAFDDKRIDTILLLSDGAPTKQNAGDLIPGILEDVRRRNKLRKIKIHTLGFDGEGRVPPGFEQPPASDPTPFINFLKKLAKDHGGKYTSIK